MGTYPQPVKPLIVCVLLAWCALTTLQQGQESSMPAASTQESAETITIPDGTRVELRFTEPLRAPLTDFPWTEDVAAAQAGDQVRLVIAENVRVDGRVVFARGAVGQVTVVQSYFPSKRRNSKNPDIDTGLVLRLDWIESVTHEKITVRSLAKSKPKAFHLMVLSAGKGYLAQPDKLSHSLVRAMTLNLGYIRELARKKDWLPAGTRVISFVQGPVKLDQSDVERMQPQFTPPDSRPLLTIYRQKDRNTELVALSCDGKEVAQLSRRQYVILELTPGIHSCGIETQTPVQLTAKPG